ncbi:DUF2487 family protein [Hazenella sp. IB182357]|uniref:DUF2487 family protein n=1 Tax=Polycladospora coralii TaxID=2771432 RepID=A0A926N8H6_9BACL|nr:DUF2487 family protein [Polycladospora coralii]MBD1371603.1 DUF2487 family protein [Polycladospora coralii]MBS7529070.1 DUF2487 family protein [Polycladospora coralii]
MLLATMKQEEWKQHASFVDTLCLPVYDVRIEGKQIMMDAAKMVEEIAVGIEKRLTGRMLLLPAIPYTGGDMDLFKHYIEHVLQTFQAAGFYHFICITDQKIQLEMPTDSMIQFLPYIVKTENVNDEEARTAEIDLLYAQILENWQKQV